MKISKPARQQWVVGAWLACLVLVGLSIWTPLELVPLPVENVPRWGLWALVLPAGWALQARWPRLRWLWRTVPWVLWGPLLAVLFFWWPMTVAQTPAKPWAEILSPLRWLFARAEEWRTVQVLFHRGHQVVAFQAYVPVNQPLQPLWFVARGSSRQAIVTPLCPGLQWAEPLPMSLDASWHAAKLDELNPVAQYSLAREQLALSGDSALHQRLRPGQQERAAAAWRERKRQQETESRLQ
jgi:hypothetical protein